MKDSEKEILKHAVEKLHRCKATWVESVPVEETFNGKTVWERIVQVFDLLNHPSAKRCYAWSLINDDSKKRRFFAVLHQPPIDSPLAAVRVTIANKFHKKDK